MKSLFQHEWISKSTGVQTSFETIDEFEARREKDHTVKLRKRVLVKKGDEPTWTKIQVIEDEALKTQTEDAGSARTATLSDMMCPLSVQLTSWDDQFSDGDTEIPKHPALDALRGKRVRVTVEVLEDEAEVTGNGQ